MKPWPFVIAAYLVTLGGAGALALVSFLAMRRAEARSEEVAPRARARGER